ncbi:MAG: peptide ABC transporter permease, partial [Thermofilum sp. ex4484_15]
MAGLRAFIISRILLTIPMIFILLTVVFYVLRMMPGDPVIAMLGEKASPKLIEEMRAKLGLNRPLIYQYIDYVIGILKGDFGKSTWTQRPVLQEILDRFPATLELAIFATLISLGIGVLGGALAAYRENTVIDLLFRIIGIVSYSLFIPWFGMILQMVFSVKLGLLPLSSRIDPLLRPRRITGLYVIDSIITGDLKALESALAHLILPSVTLGIVLSGIYIRLTRNNMIEILRQDFIRAARARGVG